MTQEEFERKVDQILQDCYDQDEQAEKELKELIAEASRGINQ